MKYFVVRQTLNQGTSTGCFRQFDTLEEAKNLLKKLEEDRPDSERVLVSKIIKGEVLE